MTKPFFDRLAKFYEDTAKVLKGKAEIASIYPNTTDIGVSREEVYAEFLRKNSPTSINVFLGGFLFDAKGRESKQLDIIATAHSAARFELPIENGAGKSFANVDGSVAVASIKSTLNKSEIYDALEGIASIPPCSPLEHVSNAHFVSDYADWPYKIIFGSDGIAREKLVKHIENFYEKNSYIPMERRPNLIHVLGKYTVIRPGKGYKTLSDKHPDGIDLEPNELFSSDTEPDLQGFMHVSYEMQKKANAVNKMVFSKSNEFFENFIRSRLR
ncbi:MAG: DUF6602 domain-containing protein [Pseudomonadota bacterium]